MYNQKKSKKIIYIFIIFTSYFLYSYCENEINNIQQPLLISIPETMPEALPIETIEKVIDSNSLKKELIISKKNKHKKPNIKTKIKKNRRIKTDIPLQKNNEKLDFNVTNLIGRKEFVTCFIYGRKRDFGNWHWSKTQIYELEHQKTVTIDTGKFSNKIDRKHVYGYLAIFKTKKEAEEATFELLDDNKKLDLDLLINLQGKTVTLTVEKYGIKGEFFEYDFVKHHNNADNENNIEIQELDFAVENKTGKTIFITCFVYEKKAKGSWIGATEEKDDMTVWRFDKTPIIKLAPKQIGIIDIDSIHTKRDRSYMRGYLAIFDESEEELANESTYELLNPKKRLDIGNLAQLKNNKMIINVEHYGLAENYIDFIVKETRSIDFTNLRNKQIKDKK